MSSDTSKYPLAAITVLLFFFQWSLFSAPGAPAASMGRMQADSVFRNDGAIIPTSPDDPDQFDLWRGRVSDPFDSTILFAPEEVMKDSIPTVDDRPGAIAREIEEMNERGILDTVVPLDSLGMERDSLYADSLPGNKSFLDDIIEGRNRDSLVYDVKNGFVFVYQEGDVDYQNLNLKADFIMMDLDQKTIFAYGVPDSTGIPTRPIFTEGDQEYTMDSILYNLDTHKARIKGAYTQEGEGILRGSLVKKMPDNTINIAHGKYSTCDHDHPHFYLAMTKAKILPGEKAVFGPSYIVMEDVPIYFLGLPFGFFPLNNENRSGFIMPSFGEQSSKGFFLRDGGYYYVPNDYFDVTLLGGIYTLGSWELKSSSRYKVRYKYTGNFNLSYSRDVFGDRGSVDFGNMTNFKVTWSHNQDAKFRPNSTFAASVNFSTSGYNKYSSNNLNDYITSQTSSSVSYSKNWAGKPYSFSTNLSHSQNNKDSLVTLGFPNFTFNVSKIYPFRRKEMVGKQRWYEKISMTYNTTFSNSVTVHEKELFQEEMFRKMRTGMNHSIPVSASFSLLNYINLTPSFNYQERWYFDKVRKEYNPETKAVETVDTIRGFYRPYNYSFSGSMNTRIYGMFQFGRDSRVQAIRHVMTPTVSFTYTPDFGQTKYGNYKMVQADSTGRITYYSPYERGVYGYPGRNRSASMSFSLANTLEMKVRSRNDSTGVRKISIIDNLSFSGSYNFLADSLNLSLISVNLRSTLIKGFAINLTGTFDTYQVDERGRRINKFLIRKGKLARLASFSTSFGYSFQLGKSAPTATDVNIYDPMDPFNNLYPVEDEDGNPIQQHYDPNVYRNLLSSQYYDFSVPFRFSFSSSLSYTNNGIKKTIRQTLSFNTGLNLTPKWAISYNGGYDFDAKQLTTGQFVLTRDLHCWQMNFNWIPTGFLRSWSFHISVKSNLLRDLKYDKSRSNYDYYYDH